MTYRLQGIFTAIADPYRREILDLLSAGQMSAGELSANFDISRPAISRHLRVLSECGLLDKRKGGRQLTYRLNPDPLAEVFEWMQKYERFWDERLHKLKHVIEASVAKQKAEDNHA